MKPPTYLPGPRLLATQVTAPRYGDRMQPTGDVGVTNERRRQRRMQARGTAVFHGPGRDIHGRVVVISETHIEVKSQLGYDLPAMLGQSVYVEVRFDGGEGGWLQLRGRVTHARPEAQRLVILVDPSQELAALIAADDEAAASRPLRVMLVDRNDERRESVARAFRDEGASVVETTTPLEALSRLDGQGDTDLIGVGPTMPESIGTELSDFLDSSHPESHVIAIDEPEAPHRPRESLASSDVHHDLRSRIRGLLARLRSRG